MAERIREIRAVYDGRVFVPKEVVDLAPGTEVEIELHENAPVGELVPGTPEAVKKALGFIDAPWYDPAKFDRSEIYP